MFSTGGPWVRMLSAVAAGMAALLVLLVVSAAGDDDANSPELSGVDVSKVPTLAKQMLPVINDVLDRQCPELPAVWVVAEVQAESGWNPKAHSADSNGGASGLYQMNDRNWAVAGGRLGEITIPETHLRVGIPWVCTNLRAVTGHLASTHKPTEPLDAMLVCHIAGCGRVTGSATGVPKVGEAGCGATCVSLINRYIANVHRYVARFSTPPAAPPRAPTAPPADVLAAGPGTVTQAAVTAQPATAGQPGAGQPDARPAVAGQPAAAQPAVAQAAIGAGGRTVTLGGITSSLPLSPAPFTGAVTGCKLSDPTSRGCLTATTLYGLESAVDAFGDFHAGPTLRSAGCWDAHAWNPTSDHAKGRACDLFPGAPGKFAQGDALVEGWRVANWYRANASALHVKYLIWQGRYWQASGRRTGSGDVGGGWGERYDGGGVYNTRSATGGHYDHVHVSYQD